MKKLDTILCAIELVIMLVCLALEFIPVAPVVQTIVLTVAAVYNLSCLIYFNVRKR